MNRVFQTVESPRLRTIERTPKTLHATIRVPDAPAFWVGVLERLANCLVRVLRMREWDTFEETVLRVLTVDREKMGDTVVSHCYDFQRRTGDWPACVLMGRDHYHRLIGELSNPLCFVASLHMRAPGRYGWVDYYGVRVVCIPWMEGMICLPDLTEELKRAR